MDYLKEVDFRITKAPAGKQRPKFSTRGRYPIAYTPGKTVDNEIYVRGCFIEKSRGRQFPEKTPLSITLYSYYPIPKSLSKKAKAAMEAGYILPVVKPDLDNVIKLIMDALNGYAWKDDNQVVEIISKKMYGVEPHTDVHIEIIETDGVVQ